MPRLNERRVAHKSTGGIPPTIPAPVDPVGNAAAGLTPNTVARAPARQFDGPRFSRPVGLDGDYILSFRT